MDGSTAGLRDAATIRVMSDALLRVSEASNLDVDDLWLADDGSGTIVVRYSKTDQITKEPGTFNTSVVRP